MDLQDCAADTTLYQYIYSTQHFNVKLNMPSKLLPIPTEFQLSSYDACKEWGAMEWYKALYIRALMRNCNKFNGTDRQSHQLDAMRFVLNPLIQDDSLHRPALMPILDQTVEEFFHGNTLVHDDKEYRLWYERQKSAAEFHCLPHEAPLLDANIYTRMEVCFQPAWEMHRQLLPPLPMQSNERFFISVDLNAPDNFLIECFERWIKDTRTKANVPSKKNVSVAKHFNKWHIDRILPYLDLSFWAEANQKHISQSKYLETLFKGFDYDEKKIGDVKAEALYLLSDTNINALKSQAYHFRDD